MGPGWVIKMAEKVFFIPVNFLGTQHVCFMPKMTGFGSKMSCKIENHSLLIQNLQYFDKIQKFLKAYDLLLLSNSCYGWKWHFLAKKHYTI